jgi:hypothetical protein
MIKDVKILSWIFKSINEIMTETPQSNSLIVSLEILEKFSAFCAASTSNEELDQQILFEIFMIFDKLIQIDDNEIYARVLNCLNNVIIILGDKKLEEKSSNILNKIVEDILKLSATDSLKLNSLENINKCSLVFKEFSAK